MQVVTGRRRQRVKSSGAKDSLSGFYSPIPPVSDETRAAVIERVQWRLSEPKAAAEVVDALGLTRTC